MVSRSAKIPLWLDCDPGHDEDQHAYNSKDAFAILLAAYHPAIDLLGISTVHGNSSIEHTTRNAGSVLTAIGRPGLPLYPGAGKPMTRPAVHAPDIHGESGLDGTKLLPEPACPWITTVPAIDAIAKALFATPANTSWLVATGTLTNLGHLFTKYPDLVAHIKGLSIMGGAIGDSFTDAPMGRVGDTLRFGNWTPYAEFNIVCDPEAADVVFSNPVLSAKTTLITLDLSHQVLATKEVQDLLLNGPPDRALAKKSPTTLRVMFIELLNFFSETYEKVFEITAGPPMHDPLAVAAVLDCLEYEIPFYDFKHGEEGQSERFNINITTEGTHEQALRGETQTGRTNAKLLDKGVPGVKIPRGLDVRRFWKVLEECLVRADEQNQANKEAKRGE